MKTKSLLISALVVIGATVSAIAKEEPTKAGLAIVSVKGSETFKVIYKTENTGFTKVNIYNAEAKVIFSKVVSNAGGFILPLNFNGLNAGEYTIELIDGTGTKVEKVNFQPSAKSSLNVHVSKMSEEGKFLLAIANSKDEEVTVTIYDNFENVLHTETKKLDGDFAQVYALKGKASSYTFEISDKSGKIKSVKF
ncbi:MAG TPA: hypothetical protein PLJ60_08770 [Chryseolinea sp.]|nr:hypothetical protein [Chryseolinea sp.]